MSCPEERHEEINDWQLLHVAELLTPVGFCRQVPWVHGKESAAADCGAPSTAPTARAARVS
jgi:hypothetical protein